MLYLHCGWPKTGTKSIQAALFRQRGPLGNAGFVYPDKWRRQLVPQLADGSHNGFADLLTAFEDSPSAVDELREFLAANADEDVLISSELIATWVRQPVNHEVARRFLAAVGEAMPVTCVWTLRRFDELACSLYLQMISMGIRLPAPVELIGSVSPKGLFAGMRQMEECVEGVAYVRYRPDGGHNAELLRAFEIPVSLSEAIVREATDEPRLNPSLTHKQAVALLNVESLSVRAGVALDEEVLREVFNAGELEFEGDGPCQLVDDRVRRGLRERALECALETGLEYYLRFYEGQEEVDEPSSTFAGTGPELLDDEDLSRLVEVSSAGVRG